MEKPMDVLKEYPVRKSGKQKATFRNAVATYVENLGYECTVEKGSMGAKNVVIGDPDTARYLITAHYDTPARMVVPNFITPCNMTVYLSYQIGIVLVLVLGAIVLGVLAGVLLNSPKAGSMIAMGVYWAVLLSMLIGPANPSNANDNTSGVVALLETLTAVPENARKDVCFVLFDLEEAGLIGSASYRKAHKQATQNQLVLNMDCVGDGDEIVLFPGKILKKQEEKLALLRGICGDYGDKSITLREKGFAYYPSDQKQFPLGVGIAAMRHGKRIGLYCDRIHTSRDTILDGENVEVLSTALLRLVSGEEE